MDLLSKLTKADHEAKPSSGEKPNHKPSNSDLLNSAKILADTAQAHFRHEPVKHDKTKVAGAAADILGAASKYGHLDEKKGAGKYVDQAEEYLRKYGNSHRPSSTAGDGVKPQKTEGGHGDFLKMAGDFLKK